VKDADWSVRSGDAERPQQSSPSVAFGSTPADADSMAAHRLVSTLMGQWRPAGTFLGSASAQLAFVIALSERHTPRAQDVVCGDGVEIEVGQRKRKDEGLRSEG
jgi:hypothetical protein